LRSDVAKIVTTMTYAGDVSAKAAWDALGQDKSSTLIDVRCRAEWTFVGVVDLRPLGREPIQLEWQSYPTMGVNREFTAELDAELRKRGVRWDTALFFLCRSGARSRAAAEAMTAVGYQSCFNVAGGFEGDVDDQQHRGRLNGWKALNLPWVQN
jgi:rhodanese-related sulfurtransferase